MATKKWVGGSTSGTTDPTVTLNWNPSGVPVNGDDVYVEGNPSGTNYSIDTALNTVFAAVTLNSFNVSQTYTANIGITNNGTNATTYAYLLLGGTNTAAITVTLGYQYGGTQAANGSPLLRLNTGSMRTTWNVIGSSASSSLANAGPVTLLGTHTSNTLAVTAGSVSICQDPTETSKILTLNNGGNLTLGLGVTLTTLNVTGGTCLIQSGFGTLTQTSGVVNMVGTGTASTLNIYGGSIGCNSTGLITTITAQAGIVDFSKSTLARTVTNVSLGAGGPQLKLNNGVKNSITITNPIVTNASPGQYTVTPWSGSSIAYS